MSLPVDTLPVAAENGIYGLTLSQACFCLFVCLFVCFSFSLISFRLSACGFRYTD